LNYTRLSFRTPTAISGNGFPYLQPSGQSLYSVKSEKFKVKRKKHYLFLLIAYHISL